MPVNPFTVRHDFRDRFRALLAIMTRTKDHDLGQLLLACSNFGFNRVGYADADSQRIAGDLAEWLHEMAESLRQELLDGRLSSARDDDTLVFLKLMMVGMDKALASEAGNVGHWRKVFIPIRSFRPRRKAVEPIGSLSKPFDVEGFNYHKVIDKEDFWRDTFGGIPCWLLYNKFPFANYHAVIVPDPTDNLPQLLEGKYHEWLWGLLNDGGVIDGLGVGYNSLGAFASVNHLHFQFLISDGGFPVADPQWRHNGGEKDYPTDCQRFDDCRSAWAYIEQLHKVPTAYNLLYLPGRVYCFPRFFQQIPKHAPWTTGFAFYEISGFMLTINREAYTKLDGAAISAELSKMWLHR